MNLYIKIFFISVFTLTACSSTNNKNNKDLPKIAIAGIAIECSTFSPAQTGEAAFHARTGEDVYDISVIILATF